MVRIVDAMLSFVNEHIRTILVWFVRNWDGIGKRYRMWGV